MPKGDLPDDFLMGFYDKSIEDTPSPINESELIQSIQHINERYLTKVEIGQGGMKLIDSCEDSVAGRRVAKARMKNCHSAADIDNFIREARLTAMLEHSNIVPLYDIGVGDDGLPYFTMKQLGGKNLQEILVECQKGAVPDDFSLTKRLDIFLKVCDAISYAHSRGIVHLDIKPANIQISEFGEVLVCDWGLARELDRSGRCETLELRKEDYETLPEVPVSLDKSIKGTPGFMAPEQINSSKFGKRTSQTDVYNLGAVLYALLVLEAPFAGDSVKDAILHTMTGELKSTIELKPELRIPQALDAVVMKAMSVEKINRYENADDLAEDIRSWLGGFATSAEDAGFIRNMALVFKRHKMGTLYATIFLALSFIVLAVAFQRINKEKERALGSEALEKEARQYAENSEKTLSRTVDDLEEEKKQRELISSKAAENFYSTALNAIRNEQYTKALTMINDILALNSNHQKALIERSRLMIGQLRFHEAYINLEKVKDQKLVKPLVDLSKKYRVIKEREGNLTIDQVFELQAEIKQISIDLNWHMQGMINKWLSKNYPLEKRLEFARRVISGDGRHKFELRKVDELYDLDISGHPGLADISVLTNLPLRSLNLSGTSVRDLSPLRDMDLEILKVKETFVSELGALQKMKLVEIDLRNSHVTKISSLNYSRMKRIYLNEFVLNLTPLFKAPSLEEIYLPKSYQNKKHLRRLSTTVKIIRY